MIRDDITLKMSNTLQEFGIGEVILNPSTSDGLRICHSRRAILRSFGGIQTGRSGKHIIFKSDDIAAFLDSKEAIISPVGSPTIGYPPVVFSILFSITNNLDI
jgi:hypothetical protein